MWISGSESSSIIRLSSSVFSPPIWSSTSLPEERLRSRMTRRNRSNSGPIGTIRVSSTPFLQAVGDPAQAVDRLGERLELLASLADPARARPGSPGNSRGAGGRDPTQRSSEPSVEPALRPIMPSRPRVMLSSRSSVSEARAWHWSRGTAPPVPGDGDEPGLGDHQLARQVHQVIEPVALDPDRLGDLALPARRPPWGQSARQAQTSCVRSGGRNGPGGATGTGTSEVSGSRSAAGDLDRFSQRGSEESAPL